MNLYVSGCSFTYGHETQENETTIKIIQKIYNVDNMVEITKKFIKEEIV